MNLFKCKMNCVKCSKFTKTNNIAIKCKRDVKINIFFLRIEPKKNLRIN